PPAFAAGGRFLGLDSMDKEFWIYDVVNGRELIRLQCPDAKEKNCVFGRFSISENGRYLASFDQDHVELWDLSTGTRTIRDMKITGYNNSVLVFSPDGTRLMAGCHLWEVPSGKDLGPLGEQLDDVEGLIRGNRILCCNTGGPGFAS